MYSLFSFFLIANFLFPLKIHPLITSGFGEFRLLRFHAGMDFSTGGKTGFPVYAAADGRVVRIRASYWGYGKVIYFQDDSTGHIFVYAHLSRFRPELERYIYQLQIKHKKYRVNDFPRDTFHFRKGELLAWTGKTGTRSPHLHFEIRNRENEPINPLFLYKLPDTTTPDIDSFRIVSCRNGEVFSTAVARDNVVLYARKSFIIETIAYDPVDNDNVTAPYKIELWHGNDLVYAVEFDTFNYSYQRASAVFYSLEGSRYGKKWIRLCNPPGFTNPFQIKAPKCYKDFGQYRIVVSDFYGHKRAITFYVRKGEEQPDTLKWDFATGHLKLRFATDALYVRGKFKLFKGKIEKRFKNGVVRVNGKDKIVLVSGRDTLKILKRVIPTNGGYFELGPYTIGVVDKGVLFNSNVYYMSLHGKDYIYPEVLPINRKITMIRVTPEKVGIFNYDNRHKKWDFVGKDTTRVITLGTFRLLKDTEPPTAKFVKITTRRIEIKVHDNLSGINSDSISFYLDGKWEPVHYYFDLKLLVYQPPYKIKRGKHRYRLVISDPLGNKKDLKGTIIVR